MQFLNRFLADERDYSQLIKHLNDSDLPLALNGLTGINKAVVASAIASGGHRLLMITDTEAAAIELKDDLVALGISAGHLPARDYNLTRIDGYSKEYEIMRIDTLSSILDGDFAVVTVSASSATQYTVSPEVLSSGIFHIGKEDTVDTDELIKKLLSYGYKRSDICEGAGQFSVRGGIMDIFAVGSKMPVRIELWGDQIDSISFFDIATQRRTEQINEFRICPACELPFSYEKLKARLESYLETDKSLSEVQRQSIGRDIDNLENHMPVNADFYLPFLYDKCATVFDYTKDFYVAVCETENVKSRLKSILLTEAGDISDLLESGLISHKTAKLRMDEAEFNKCISNALLFESFPRSFRDISPAAVVNFGYMRLSPWGGNLNNLIDDINQVRFVYGTAVVFAGGEKAAKLLAENLSDNGIPAQFLKDESQITKDGVFILSGGFSSSFQIPSKKAARYNTQAHFSI